jgi:hypothetical protein
MKMKNFIIAGVVGGLVNFLLGWLFYGMLFKDFFPQDDSNMRMVFIFLGCLIYGLFIAYIFTKWAGISHAATGAKAGAIIGFFFAVSVNLFMMSSSEPDIQRLVMDTAISIVMSAIVGAVIAVVNGKLK